MNDSDNICLACGLCCDGTLIGHVQLDREELPTLKKLMEIEDENSNGFFLQPCDKYCDGCTIYSQRPKQCDNFKCDLLNSVESKKTEFSTALDAINSVKQQKTLIEKKLAKLTIKLHSKSFHFKMVELKKLLKQQESESLLSQDHLDLRINLEKLNNLLLQKFGVSLY